MTSGSEHNSARPSISSSANGRSNRRGVSTVVIAGRPLALEIQRDIQRRRAVGQLADRDDIDA